MTEKLEIQYVELERLLPYARNARTHTPRQVDQIAASIREFGWTNPVLVSGKMDGKHEIVAGHGRVLAAKQLGLLEIPVLLLAHLSPAQRRAYVLADNKLAEKAGWDDELLRLELGQLKEDGFDLGLIGFEPPELDALFNPEVKPASNLGSMADRFLVAPFSVLNAREGWWQTRKKAWLGLGIRSELGREENLLRYSNTVLEPDAAKRAAAEAAGEEIQGGTSVFDPVLTEIAYRWWCPPGGNVLDSFAGGSVRGIVASRSGRFYTGVDLRQEQVSANFEQAKDIADAAFAPQWLTGDSSLLLGVMPQGYQADFLFTCPPYFDLEQYSENPHDLSNAPSYKAFLSSYGKIIKAQAALLREDRFAAIVVGDIRDKAGIYRGLVGDTIEAFRAAGLQFYNEAILVTPVGSLPVRMGRQFGKYRKLGRTHQNLLVFVKGDWKRASLACGELTIPEDIFAGLEESGGIQEEQQPSLVPDGLGGVVR